MRFQFEVENQSYQIIVRRQFCSLRAALDFFHSYPRQGIRKSLYGGNVFLHYSDFVPTEIEGEVLALLKIGGKIEYIPEGMKYALRECERKGFVVNGKLTTSGYAHSRTSWS